MAKKNESDPASAKPRRQPGGLFQDFAAETRVARSILHAVSKLPSQAGRLRALNAARAHIETTEPAPVTPAA